MTDLKFERKVKAYFDNGIVSICTLDKTYKTVSETMRKLLSSYAESFQDQKSKVPAKMVFTTELMEVKHK